MTRKERVISNLSQYPHIGKFLGNAIRKRLEIRGYTRGILTAHLLDDELSKKDLERLEQVLQLGEKHCIDFRRIFREMNLPNKDLAIDGEIINTLAEVKAFEFLYSNQFEMVKKIRRTQKRTVDFFAVKKGMNYAVEVTRLGLAQTDRKKPVYLVKDKIPPHNIPGIRELVGEFFLISGKDNISRIIEAIRDTINKKLPQMKDFCQIQGDNWNGILIISTGRDYFVVNKYTKTEFEMHPNAVEEALKKVWGLLIEERGDFNYLHHVVITIGKDLGKEIIYPRFG